MRLVIILIRNITVTPHCPHFYDLWFCKHTFVSAFSFFQRIQYHLYTAQKKTGVRAHDNSKLWWNDISKLLKKDLIKQVYVYLHLCQSGKKHYIIKGQCTLKAMCVF